MRHRDRAARRPGQRHGDSAQRDQREPGAPDDRRRTARSATLTPRERRARCGSTSTDLSLAPPDPFGTSLKDISLQVRSGEIVGIAGVSGNGQKELMAALSGERLSDAAR